MRYPKSFRGDEYYPRRSKEFYTDPLTGDQVYATDRKGNERYPKRKCNYFARNRFGREYYARDSKRNEFYPKLGGKSRFIYDPYNVKIARFADGTQRYPTDQRGNEYYLRHEGKPFPLRDAKGVIYWAKTRRGHEMIPKEYVENEKGIVFFKDAEGNFVYVKNLNKTMERMFRCICEILMICPPITAIMTII